MKKIILFLSLVCVLFLYGCASEYENYLPLDVNQENMICVEAVKNYLNEANMKGRGSKIKQGDSIVVDYIGRLEDGTVFDTSVEAVAMACGTYNAGRDYESGLPFTVGAGQMIAGFDKGVIGMKSGQTKTIKIVAKEAYGEWDESALVPVEKDAFVDMGDLKKGDKVMTSIGQQFEVYEVRDNQIILDTNPPLAGKDLVFDITIKKIDK